VAAAVLAGPAAAEEKMPIELKLPVVLVLSATSLSGTRTPEYVPTTSKPAPDVAYCGPPLSAQDWASSNTKARRRERTFCMVRNQPGVSKFCQNNCGP